MRKLGTSRVLPGKATTTLPWWPAGAGVVYAFDAGTTDADPGSGNVRFNNAAPASATEIYLDDLEVNGVNLDGLWTGAVDRLFVKSLGEPGKFHIFDVSAQTDQTGYHKLTVAHVDGAGVFATGDLLVIEPTVAGPARVGSHTVATLPGASGSGAGAMIYVSDEVGGAVIAFSDGTNWRRVTDRAVVS
jgi:hypothetical protein